MSGHTPGPWKVEPYGLIHTDYEGRSIAIIDWKSSSPKWTASELSEQNNHNARLIAAAPELLEALDELANGYAGNGWDVGLVPRLNKARAAIAKAKGGV